MVEGQRNICSKRSVSCNRRCSLSVSVLVQEIKWCLKLMSKAAQWLVSGSPVCFKVSKLFKYVHHHNIHPLLTLAGRNCSRNYWGTWLGGHTYILKMHHNESNPQRPQTTRSERSAAKVSVRHDTSRSRQGGPGPDRSQLLRHHEGHLN